MRGNKLISALLAVVGACLSALSHAGSEQSYADQMGLSGKFSVSPTGASSYTVPLEIPPGIAGLEPKLALSYSSQSAGGLAGQGWSLSGLSMISRCPRTVAQDNVRGAVGLNGDDRFCLDGQRLVLISSGAYGAAGTEYRLERDGLSKIIAYGGSTSNGPDYFVVQTKSGLTIEYGKTTDSRLVAQGKSVVALWAQNKTSDRKGNYLTWSYVQNSGLGELYPSEIDYTGSSLAGPVAKILFTNEARPDIWPTYTAGSLTKFTQRLSTIQTVVGDVAVKTYRISYQSTVSRLTDIQECSGSGSLCKPAIHFSWNSAQNGYDVGSFVSADDTCMLECGSWLKGDFFGSGRLSMAHITTTPGFVILWNRLADGTYQVTGFNTSSDWDLQNGTWMVGDVNGDGRTDLIHITENPGQIITWLSNGDGTFGFASYVSSGDQKLLGDSTVTWFVGDFNGDGRADLAHVTTNSGQVITWLSNGDGSFNVASYISGGDRDLHGLATNSWLAGDVNGDGKTDLIHVTTNGGQVINWLSVGDGSYNVVSEFSTSDTDMTGTWMVGDFNGDGKADLVHITHADAPGLVATWLSRGDGVGVDVAGFNSGADQLLYGDSTVGWQVGDVNGDGKTDLIHVTTNTGQVIDWLSVGDGSYDIQGYTSSGDEMLRGESTIAFLVGDVDGDGKADILHITTNSGQVMTWISNFILPEKVTSIASGLGETTNVTYSTLSQMLSTRYQHFNADDYGWSYPYAVLSGPMRIVTDVDVSNGAGGLRRLSYWYDSAIWDFSGRGFLGFTQTASQDMSTSALTSNYYSQIFPFTGILTDTYHWDTSTIGTPWAVGGKGVQISADGFVCLNPATNTLIYDSRDFSAGMRCILFLQQQTKSAYDLDGSFMSQVSTQNQVDSYGNPLVVSKYEFLDKALQVRRTTVTTNTYDNDESTWQLGKLRKSVTSITE
jgi:hypothetical protein